MIWGENPLFLEFHPFGCLGFILNLKKNSQPADIVDGNTTNGCPKCWLYTMTSWGIPSGDP